MSRTAPSPRDDQAALAARLGHAFTNPELLTRALTHPSVSGAPGAPRDNQRLEFLGDRVLGMIVAERLFRDFPDQDEAQLAPRLNAIVNKSACAGAAEAAGIGPHLRLSPGEARAGGRRKEAILGDACEAVIAALYLDGGWAPAEAFVARYFADAIAAAGRGAPPRDSKSALQEWALATFGVSPRYEVINREGPDHAPRFVVAAIVAELAPARGEAGSKRDAEREAAAALLAREGVNA